MSFLNFVISKEVSKPPKFFLILKGENMEVIVKKKLNFLFMETSLSTVSTFTKEKFKFLR